MSHNCMGTHTQTMKLVPWRHWSHFMSMHQVTSDGQFHCPTTVCVLTPSQFHCPTTVSPTSSSLHFTSFVCVFFSRSGECSRWNFSGWEFDWRPSQSHCIEQHRTEHRKHCIGHRRWKLIILNQSFNRQFSIKLHSSHWKLLLNFVRICMYVCPRMFAFVSVCVCVCVCQN